MSRAQVDGLHLAAVTLRRAGIEQDTLAGHPGGAVGVEGRHRSRGEHDVPGNRAGLAGFDLEAGLPPGAQSTIKNTYVGDARPTQQPPRPRCGLSLVVVVDHNRSPGGQAPAAG